MHHAPSRAKVPSLIVLDNARSAVDASVLDKAGGFAWWYAELMDAHGSGAVLIWSFGLPFLPGYKSANDRGKPQTPRQRPSLNIALYEGGQPSFYVLHEFDPDDVEWDGHHSWRFGDSTFVVQDTKTHRSLYVELDVPISESLDRLRGSLTVEGPIPSALDTQCEEQPSVSHKWTPLALPAQGSIDVNAGDYQLTTRGHAYFDRNFSAHALHELGIDRWFWGHASGADGDRIFYVLWEDEDAPPLCLGFEVALDGTTKVREGLTAKLSGEHRTVWGMRSWKQVELWDGSSRWISCRLSQRIENGPFYLRYLAHSIQESGHVTTGSAEVIEPKRIDMWQHRPLVKMRVSSDQAPNSMWIALFEGTNKTRLQRLMKSKFAKLRGRY